MVEVLLSVGVAVLTVAGIWFLRRLSFPLLTVLAGWILVVIIAAGLGLLARGSLYPWSNILVALLALGIGMLVGRLPTWWIVALFVAVSAADVFSFVSGVQSAPSPPMLAAPMLLGNLIILLPHGHFRLGVLDIGLLAAAAYDWWQRLPGWAPPCLATTALLIPDLIALLGSKSGIPLTPFIAAVWLASLAIPTPNQRMGRSGSHPSNRR